MPGSPEAQALQTKPIAVVTAEVSGDTPKVYNAVEILPPVKSSPRVPPALRGIDVTLLQSRAQLVQALTKTLPMNEYNLPAHIYRPDILDYTLFAEVNEAVTPEVHNAVEATDEAPEPSAIHTTTTTTDPRGSCDSGPTVADSSDRYEAMQDMLVSSTIVLQYHEGYPALPNGKPLWDRFDFEALEEFELFKQYLEQPGARQLALIVGAKHQDVQELFHLHYWSLRCLASDAFAVAHYQRLREQRILSTENAHYIACEKMITELTKRMTSIDWASVQDPRVFMELMEKLQKLQRLSLGLSANGQQQQVQSPSVELIMRKVTAANGGTQESKTDDSQFLELLADPELAGQAQELIMRINK